jgi:hypothetical protein
MLRPQQLTSRLSLTAPGKTTAALLRQGRDEDAGTRHGSRHRVDFESPSIASIGPDLVRACGAGEEQHEGGDAGWVDKLLHRLEAQRFLGSSSVLPLDGFSKAAQ